jgi:hypothetical protein
MLFFTPLLIILNGEGFDWQELIIIAIPMILWVIGLISHFIFYSALKKKYNFEMSVLLYGVGFTSCCVIFVLLILGVLHGGPLKEYFNLWLLYIFPFTFLYYSYATLLQNNEKDINKNILYLTAATILSFAVLIIIEIMIYGPPVVGALLLPFGLYFAYCLIRKKGVLSLQAFAWSPFLPAFVAFWVFILYSIITTPF